VICRCCCFLPKERTAYTESLCCWRDCGFVRFSRMGFDAK